MIGVELADEVIELVAVVVVEEGEVSLLAARPPRPGRPMVVLPPFARGYPDAPLGAPVDGFRRRVLVCKPGVMRVVLSKHGRERFRNDAERFGGCLGDDHRDPAAGG